MRRNDEFPQFSYVFCYTHTYKKMKTSAQSHRHRKNIAVLAFTALLVSACSSGDVEVSKYSSVNEAVDAATGPLEDLNIKKRDIPEILRLALRDPYAKPAKAKCAVVKEEIAKLDEVLGPDMGPREEIAGEGEFMSLANFEGDVPSAEGAGDAAFGLAKDAAIGAIRSQTDILPFRSIIRRITGANKHQKKVTMSYEAGKLRRAYLKGYAQERFGKRCLAPEPVVEAKATPPKDPNQ